MHEVFFLTDNSESNRFLFCLCKFIIIIIFFLFSVAQCIGSHFAADEIAMLVIRLVVDGATIVEKPFKKRRMF